MHLTTDSYLEQFARHADPVLLEMEAHAARLDFPIVGPQVGRLLCQLARLARPAEVMELGSGFGYSALWILKGAPGARILCTEKRRENIQRAEEWLRRAGCWDRTAWRQEDALDVLRRTSARFDFILNDCDKESYPEALDLALAHLNPGGLLVSDNLLRRGRVADLSDTGDDVRAIRIYNDRLRTTPGLLSVLLPVRDGVGVSLYLPGEDSP